MQISTRQRDFLEANWEGERTEIPVSDFVYIGSRLVYVAFWCMHYLNLETELANLVILGQNFVYLAIVIELIHYNGLALINIPSDLKNRKYMYYLKFANIKKSIFWEWKFIFITMLNLSILVVAWHDLNTIFAGAIIFSMIAHVGYKFSLKIATSVALNESTN